MPCFMPTGLHQMEATYVIHVIHYPISIFILGVRRTRPIGGFPNPHGEILLLPTLNSLSRIQCGLVCRSHYNHRKLNHRAVTEVCP
jgi:hypothetical protein